MLSRINTSLDIQCVQKLAPKYPLRKLLEERLHSTQNGD